MERHLGSENFVHTRTFFHAAVVVVILGFTVILNLKLNPKGCSKIFRRTLPTIVRLISVRDKKILMVKAKE